MARDPTGMHVEDIKAALRRRHGTLRALAATWGRHPSSISRALTNPCFSVPTEKLIAKALKMPLHDIWPDRWTEAGESLPRSTHKNATRNKPPVTSQKRRAA